MIGLAGVVESEGGPKRFPKVVVDYRVGDASFRTTLRVLWAHEFEVGSTIAIIYDPIHPEHARPVEGWGPLHRVFLTVAAMATVGAVFSALRTPGLLRADIAAATSGVVTTMGGAPYHRSRWRVFELSVAHLVGLWPSDADRSRPPPLSVKVDPGFHPGRPGPVRVIGRPEPGHHVVLRVGGQTVWTNGVIKEGIDPKAKPGRG